MGCPPKDQVSISSVSHHYHGKVLLYANVHNNARFKQRSESGISF